MTIEIELNGRVWTADVESIDGADRRHGRFRVILHDATDPAAVPAALDVDARRTDLGLSLAYPADARIVDAALTARPGGEYFVQLPHVDLTALVDGRRARLGGRGPGGAGEERVTAPMPGRVLRVLVSAGDEVAARQGLVVVEAMKMENELTAARPGRVRDVHVSEGTSVEAGRLLVVLEPIGLAGGHGGLR